MNDINEVLKKAEDLGVKDKLLHWVENNKEWDPSLTSDLVRYYDMGLKIITDSDSQKKSDSFEYGYWKTSGHSLAPEGNREMYRLLQEYSKMHQSQTLDNESYSQIGQDAFVINLLQKKRNGLFLDIGAGPPKFISNTYLLEKKYDWTGASIELDHRSKVAWQDSDRKSKFLYEDAFEIDYDKLITTMLADNNKTRIDYLSVDLEPPTLTLEALYKVITSTKHRFTVITFEHDAWRGFDYILKASRQLLASHNYQIVAENVNNQEDWYVDLTF